MKCPVCGIILELLNEKKWNEHEHSSYLWISSYHFLEMENKRLTELVEAHKEEFRQYRADEKEEREGI